MAVRPHRRVAGLAGLLILVAAAAAAGAAEAARHEVMWAGGVTDTEARFRLRNNVGRWFQVVSTKPPAAGTGSSVDPAQLHFRYRVERPFSSLRVDGLTPNSRYWYGFFDPEDDVRDIGTFVTHPTPGTALSFDFVFGSCSQRPEAPIYGDMAQRHPQARFFLQTGDFFYGDIEENSYRAFDQWWADTLRGDDLTTLLRSMPVAYMWDDHDYGNNDAGAGSPVRLAARLAYHRNVPHYDLLAPAPADTEPITPANLEAFANVGGNDANSTTIDVIASIPMYQAFTVGRVRFILTDLRSELLARSQMMGPDQEAWFYGELAGHADYALLVWVSTMPWIGQASADQDNWTGHQAERVKLSNYIAENKVDNLVMLSGDAHMLAIDNGMWTDYSTVPGMAGFPIFQAAPLDNTASSKGGLFSEGCHGYYMWRTQQYGYMRITDDGPDGPVCFTWRGFREDEQLMFYEQCRDPNTGFLRKGEAGGGRGKCILEVWPTGMWLVFTLAVFAWIGLWVGLCYVRRLSCLFRSLVSLALCALLGFNFLIAYAEGRDFLMERMWIAVVLCLCEACVMLGLVVFYYSSPRKWHFCWEAVCRPCMRPRGGGGGGGVSKAGARAAGATGGGGAGNGGAGTGRALMGGGRGDDDDDDDDTMRQSAVPLR